MRKYLTTSVPGSRASSMSEQPGEELRTLQDQWKQMFQKTLPDAAKFKSVAQRTWPVQLDHCFARIILDNTVGVDTPWTGKIKSPAYKNMTIRQLQESIAMGERILKGEIDLVKCDDKSLELRGKREKGGEKRKREGGSSPSSEDVKESAVKRRKTVTENAPDGNNRELSHPQSGGIEPSADFRGNENAQQDLMPYHLKKIALSSKTAFQKKVLTALCQVPRGHYTTYGAISNYLDSSPRAVGNALRNNPFAPGVPCHRVLASGGGLGGFHGSWGKGGQEGLHDDKKRSLLRDEGVKFDGKGKVVGSPWEGFK